MDWGSLLSGILGAVGKTTGFGIGHSGPATGSLAGTQQAGAIAAEASALGVSPLALLGQSFPSGGSSGFQPVDVGQDISRAVNALKPVDDTLKKLTERNMELRNLELETSIKGTLQAQQDRALAAAGNPPPFYGDFRYTDTGGFPFPSEDPRGLAKGMPEVIRPFYSGDPRHPVYGFGREFGLQFEPPGPLKPITYPALVGLNVGSGVGALSDDAQSIISDAARYFGWK